MFWIVDNGSAHRGRSSIERLQRRWPNLRLVHLPVHASWLNQAEIFSIVQRKVLQPNDFESTAQVARILNEFDEIAEPFDWRFTRDDLEPAHAPHRRAQAAATPRRLTGSTRLLWSELRPAPRAWDAGAVAC